MNFSVAVYAHRGSGGLFSVSTIGLGEHNRTRSGKNVAKLQRKLIDDLRKAVAKVEPGEAAAFIAPPGVGLERIRVELNLRGKDGRRKLSGQIPVVTMPRYLTEHQRVQIGFHPAMQDDWFVVGPDQVLSEQAVRHLNHAWADAEQHILERLVGHEKSSLRLLSFSAEPKSILEAKTEGDRRTLLSLDDGLGKRPKRGKRRMRVLPKLGLDLTERVASGELALCAAREPLSSQLLQLVLGDRSVALVGASRVGKTVLLDRLVDDLLQADDYPTHQNLDKVRHVWRVRGRELIAGMSYFGQWEERILELIEDLDGRRVILRFEDLGALSRLGRTRGSDRNIADLLRGPMARGKVQLLGECSEEDLARLQYEAPAFARLITPLRVSEASHSETASLLFQVARELETTRRLAVEASAIRTLIELSERLLPESNPGKAVDVLRAMFRRVDADKNELTPDDVVNALAERTGLAPALIDGRVAIDPAHVTRGFGRGLMGQSVAVQTAIDVVCRVKAGLCDDARPLAVVLLTGPTGTGKTEWVKLLTDQLYGDRSRLLRFDMGEYAGPDAVVRLIGDGATQGGRLTDQVRSQPYSIVLLDEIEKAHPSVLNLLLQVFDAGRLTDATGAMTDFRRSILVMTSNLGAASRPPVGFGDHSTRVLADIASAVREYFSPELFNRIDRVVPFGLLTPEAAERIVEKELVRLLGRRGLTERNVFVFIGKGAAKKIVTEGFSARDGARSVKRYLERNIAGLLARELCVGAPSEMRVCRVYVRGDGFGLHTQSLSEAQPKVEHLRLETEITLSGGALRERLPAAREAIEALLESEQLSSLVARMNDHLARHRQGEAGHEDALFNLDSMRGELVEFRGRLDSVLSSELAERPVVQEMLRDARRDRAQINEGRRISPRVLSLRWLPDRVVPTSREQMLGILAEVHFLRRALDVVDDVEQHAVFLDVSRLGQAVRSDESGLFEWLVAEYATARGQLAEFAVWHAERGLLQGVGTQALMNVLTDDDAVGATHACLKMVGVSVAEFFRGEHGTHVWNSVAFGAEITRVAVSPTAGEHDAGARLERRVKSLADFEAALDAATVVPGDDPMPLLPVVRRLQFEPPMSPSHSVPIEVEDYHLGYATMTRATGVADVLRRIWMLSMSAELSSEGR